MKWIGLMRETLEMSMYGPSCLGWVPLGSGGSSAEAFDRAARAIADSVPNASGFLTSDTRPIGGRLLEAAILVHVRPEYVCDESDVMQVEAAFGFWPEPVPLRVGASVNTPSAHHAVADLAAWLAGEFGGVVDLLGPVPATGPIGRSAVFRSILAPTGDARTVLDAVAMRAWAKHPNCWMMV